MNKILIFGGTSEGRHLVEYFSKHNIEVHVSVATEYGEEVLESCSHGTILQGRLTPEEMQETIKQGQYDCVIDATHPYAVLVTKYIQQACAKVQIPYFRVIRNSVVSQSVQYVASAEEAVTWLEHTTGNIFLSTGSKELAKYTKLSGFTERVYARVLPSVTVLEQCKTYGMTGKHILCMQGPFSEEMNLAQFRHTKASYLVTKESGKAGGFLEKIKAAQTLGISVIVIGRNPEPEGYTVQELVRYFIQHENFSPKQTVTLVGIGMGKYSLTQEAVLAVQQADVIIGAKRMLDALASYEKETFAAYQPEKILQFLENHSYYTNVVVAFSGDIGFFSGAKKLLQKLGRKYPVRTICGISSLTYFMGKLQIAWDDVRIFSLHGKEAPVASYVSRYEKCFFLLGTKDGVSHLCQELCNKGLETVRVFVGERLSYPEERIVEKTAFSLQQEVFDPLSVALVWNENARKKTEPFGIPDTEFIRENIPMTKREVRTISLSYLDLEDTDIVYDIGAGTGSVSIEIAKHCPLGTVYSIEQKAQACLLLQQNREKFHCYNMNIIAGTAPEKLESLPVPTKVFIGGSAGKLESILSCVLQKNPQALVMMNCIALETLAEVMRVFQKLGMKEMEYTQVAISKGEPIGRYHLMKGQNPVYIIKGKGCETDELS